MFSHNQLYGNPRTRRQLRLAIHPSDRSHLLYRASDIEVLDSKGLETHVYLSRLGPDLLDARVSAADALERLRDGPFARRQIGHLLLDQGFLAGVGSYPALRGPV